MSGKQTSATEAGTPSSKASAGSQPALASVATPEAKTPQQASGRNSSALATPVVDNEQASDVRDITAGRTDSPTAASAAVTPATPIAITGRHSSSAGRRSSGSDIAGTSAEGAWGSSNSGSGWASYRQGKKKAALGPDPGALGKSPGSDAGVISSKAGRRARRNAKKAAADAKADVYAY